MSRSQFLSRARRREGCECAGKGEHNRIVRVIIGRFVGTMLGIHDRASVVAVDNSDHTIRSDTTPQGADSVKASEDLHGETQVLVLNGYHTETARLGRRDHIAELHLALTASNMTSELLTLLPPVSLPAYPKKKGAVVSNTDVKITLADVHTVSFTARKRFTCVDEPFLPGDHLIVCVGDVDSGTGPKDTFDESVQV